MSTPPATNPHSTNRVFYRGRFDTVVQSTQDCAVLSDWDVAPTRLYPLFDHAQELTVVDPLSFPWESLRDGDWDIPITVHLPDEPQLSQAISLLDRPLLSRLGFFDRISVDDDALWHRLRQQYTWANSQRLSRHDLSRNTLSAPRPDASDDHPLSAFAKRHGDPLDYWRRRGSVLAQSAPHRAVCSVRHDLATNKQVHNCQTRILRPMFHRTLDDYPQGFRPMVLEVGMGVGRLATLFGASHYQYFGVDVSAGMLAEAQRNFPELVCREIAGSELPFDDESLDVTFTVSVLHHNTADIRRRLLAEMFRVTRSGGQLIFLEDFVGAPTDDGLVFPTTLSDFFDVLIDETAGCVNLEGLESLRYPYDVFHRAAALRFTKIQVPQTW